jgi:FKBP-type peptidyl-prolyl cis-trans isomerase (trigger factor)
MNKGYTYKTNKASDHQYKIEVEVEPVRVKDAYEEALKELGKDVKVQGFRAGKAPRAMIEAKIGNDAFSHAIRHLLSDIAIEIVDEEKLNPVTPLDYSVEKASVDGNVAFSFTFTNYPEVKIAELSNVQVEREVSEVLDEDIDKVIANLRDQSKKDKKDKKEEKGDKNSEEKNDEKEVELTDKEVKGLGFEGVGTIDELRALVRERLADIKSQEPQARFEQEVIEKVIEVSDIPLPKALLDRQVEMLMDSYMSKIKELDVKPEEFLQAQGLTMDSLRKQKEEQAMKQLKSEILLNEIAKKYEISPASTDIEAQLNAITDPELRAKYDTYEGRRYILSALLQQRSMAKLLSEVKIVDKKATDKKKVDTGKKAEKAKKTDAKK